MDNPDNERTVPLSYLIAAILLFTCLGIFIGNKLTENSMLEAIAKGDLYSITHNNCTTGYTPDIPAQEVPSLNWTIHTNGESP